MAPLLAHYKVIYLGLYVNYRILIDFLRCHSYCFARVFRGRPGTVGKKDITSCIAKDVSHISDKETVSDLSSLLARVRESTEVVIEHNARPAAVVPPVELFRGRLLSEFIALPEADAKALGYKPTLDPDFLADLGEIINSGQHRVTSQHGNNSRFQHSRLS